MTYTYVQEVQQVQQVGQYASRAKIYIFMFFWSFPIYSDVKCYLHEQSADHILTTFKNNILGILNTITRIRTSFHDELFNITVSLA